MFSVKMMPVCLSKLSKDISLNASNLLFDDSNSQEDDDSRNIEWPLLECVVSIIELLIGNNNNKGQKINKVYKIIN